MTTRGPTTEGEALLAAILGRPGDDAVRLIYADWLDDHGDHGRAEFIRDQVLFRDGCNDYDLLADNVGRWWRWRRPLPTVGLSRQVGGAIKVVHADGSETSWWRGFVFHLAGTYPHAPAGVPWAAFAREPITAVRLESREPLECYPPTSLRPPHYGWSLPSWGRGGVYARSGECPAELEPFLLDLPGPGNLWQAEGVVVYPTRDDALKALSDACVAYGRHRAAVLERGA